VAAGVVLALAGGAFADQISNNLDATVDASFETLSLNQDGAAQAVSYAVNPTNGDGKNGCNLTGQTTLSVLVHTSDSTVATVTPSSLTFTSCGDLPTITVTPHAAGSADIMLSETSNDTIGSFDLATAAFTVNVAGPSNTAPAVTIGGVTNGGDYDKGSVPTAVCHVSDTEDGLSDSTTAATPTLSAIGGPYAADGIGEQTATCSYTDGGGLTTTASATYTISDASAPEIGDTISGTLGNNGWYTSDVTLTWSVTESQSPSSLVKTGCVDESITADQASTDYSCAATSAGGSAGPVTVSIKRDATPPTIACASPDTAWHADDVTIACSGLDATSGLADSADASFNLSTSVADDTETSDASTDSHDVYDNAGNESTAGPVTGIKIDKKAPTYSCDAVPAAWSASNVTVNCAAADGGSGLANPADASFTLSTSVAAGTETSDASTGSKSLADAVGNSTTAGPLSGLKVDRKAPTYSCDPMPTGWSANDISLSCTAQDAGSGLANAADASFALSTSVAAGTETANASTGSKDLADAVGNSLTAGPISGGMVDKKGPTVTLTCPSNVVQGSSASAGWTASDGGSGVAAGYTSGTISGLDTSTIGSHTATAAAGTARDNVGNNNSPATSCTYAVIYHWTGFFQPIDNLPTTNVVKAGSAVPVKFSLSGNQGLNIFTSGYPTSNVAACDATAADDAIEQTLTAGNSSLSYDATNDQYVYVWKTDKAWAGTCRQLRVKLADGTLHAADFKLTK